MPEPRPTSRGPDRRISYVDSHTEGEPTRVLLDGVPDLGPASALDRRERLARDHDWVRRLSLAPPRGSPETVGALLGPGAREDAHSVVFFNNAGYLGMCGHGTIGVLVTLGHLGRMSIGESHRLETPVGPVEGRLHAANEASFRNVPSYRLRSNVPVEVPGHAPIVGEIAWGGNWFFLAPVEPEEIRRDRLDELHRLASEIRHELARRGLRGENGAEIDHVELVADADHPGADGKNYVLCPGGEFDRSPCGTGTSAKVACLVADGRLRPGDVWRQEGILGTQFAVEVQMEGDRVTPIVRGHAYLTGEGTLLWQDADPLREGP